jgi:type II secretory pathway pseudopilin PulG
MGLFDLPAPLFDIVDQAMAMALPPALRLAVWALLGSVLTMFLYKLLSPQDRIGAAKREAKAARARLNAFDGDFADAGPLIKNQFVTAFRHVGLVVPGTLLAILPLLALLLWAETHYGHALPPADQAPQIATVPDGFATRWDATRQPAQLSVADGATPIADIDMTVPVGIVTKQPWWHWLAENPLGYLPDDAPIDRVQIDLPTLEVISFGPDWMRSWLFVFIPVMFIVSLAIFKWAKIE